MANPAVKNTDTKVVTGKVRFSYAHVFEPYAHEQGQEEKYSVCLLIPKEDKRTLQSIKNAIEAAKVQGQAKWGGKVPPTLKLPLRDGDTERPDSPEYAGMYFLNASSKNPPGIVDRKLREIIDSSEFYSGCYGKASINFYPFSVSGNKGIAAGLNNLQKTDDGDYLGGRSRAEDDFEALEEEGEDDFLN